MDVADISDVIVVGSGPAGTTAAHLLARRGYRVLILERDRLPRVKTCAGGVPRKSIAALPVDVSETYEAVIRRGLVTYRARRPIELALERSAGWTVMRANFDTKLARAAEAAGAQLIEGCRVRGMEQGPDGVVVTTDGRAFQGRYVIGADGVNSVVARAAGLLPNRRKAIAFEAELPATAAQLEQYHDTVVFDFGGVPHGYAWIFAKSDHLSVGAAVFGGDGGKEIRAHMIAYAVRAGLMREGQPLECFCKGHPIPMGGGTDPLHRDRVLVVGDAANLADPFLGEGIYYAIRSGHLAAQTLERALSGQVAGLAEYTDAVHAELTREFRFAQRYAQICYAAPLAAHTMFAVSPQLRAGLAHMIEGDGTWEGLWHDGVRAFLPFLPRRSALPPAPMARMS